MPARRRPLPVGGRRATAPVIHQGLVQELIRHGATSDDLLVIGSGRDIAHGSELISQHMQADRSEAILLCGAWIGAVVAFAVGDFVLVSTIHDAVYSGADYVSVSGLTVGALASAVTARDYLLKARRIMRKLLRLQRVLARWSA